MAEDKSLKSDTALKEEVVLKFWAEHKVFEQSLKKPAPQGEFVFYDGPPFATGLPHSGSLLSSVSKDVIPRYKTMRGYFVRRRWGWDTHGLPIESLVEKELGLKNKREILEVGIEKFNEKARSMVLTYVHDWKRYVDRVGRWVDYDNAYTTMDSTFIESVWWGLKQIHEKGNLYEGRKVLMYCPHCETPLAKAEIAMDNTYKDVTEESAYVKFRILHPEKLGLSQPTFMVAWTTTPWTLPGNVALAVGPEIEYVYVPQGGEVLVVAKERAAALGLDASTKPIKGREFVGLLYEPLYEIEKVKEHSGKKWQVLSADFVTTGEGTGVVHTAVIYGEDDYQLGVKEGLPMVPLLNPNATYNTDAPEFVRGQYIKKAEALIKNDLESRGLMFKKEAHTHSYPHCYRCGTALIYNAVSSWFINIQSIKDKLLSENEKINWVPGHLKHGRFQKNLETAPDWTISRNRFWASPLPIWKDSKGKVTVVGSLEELKSLTKKSGNTYFMMRHGEAEINVSPVWKRSIEDNARLTEHGRSQVVHAAAQFKTAKPDIIICSPMLRARETVEILCKEIGYPLSAVEFDDRLHEWRVDNSHEGKPLTEVDALYDEHYILDPRRAFKDGENFAALVHRVGEFLYEVENRYTGKQILMVTHDGMSHALQSVADGRMLPSACMENVEVRKLTFVPLPHNRDYELDYHLPYIDEVQLEKNGVPLTRIPEVVDCWVESGSMPFAEYHYPFENKAEFEKRSPGDFVSEYIGQTRAWFYYMHAMSVHVFGHQAFKNVITTGNVNAADGQKLSKSKKNYTDPYLLFDQYGADAFRFYLMSSVVMQAEDMQFRDDEVKDVHARVVNLLRNIKLFYALFANEAQPASNTSTNLLDRWILTRLDNTLREVTEEFDAYNTARATRPMRDFIDDLSTWYVRRSRDRVKKGGGDASAALGTLRYVLREFSKVIAPVMPFIADEVYREVRSENDPVSVHLTDWPVVHETVFNKIKNIFAPKASDEWLLGDMEEVRALVSAALDVRQKANIKVRQPLSLLKVKSDKLVNKEDLLQIIADEVNVKKVLIDNTLTDSVQLDTTITEELREEGELRDLIREIQDLRKQAGLNPKDQAVLTVPADRRAFVEKHWDALAKTTSLKGYETGPVLGAKG